MSQASADFVDDDRGDVLQILTGALCRYEEVERFRRGDHERWWTLHHRSPFVLGGVTGADTDRQVWRTHVELRGCSFNFTKRSFEVLADVDRKCAQR